MCCCFWGGGGLTFHFFFVSVFGILLMGGMMTAVTSRDAASVMAAVAVANGSARLSALKESPFLPSVSGESRRIL